MKLVFVYRHLSFLRRFLSVGRIQLNTRLIAAIAAIAMSTTTTTFASTATNISCTFDPPFQLVGLWAVAITVFNLLALTIWHQIMVPFLRRHGAIP